MSTDIIQNILRTGPQSQISVASKVVIVAAILVGLRVQYRLPGTEFLGAETKRQKSPLKCANVRGDQNPGSGWPEIPAETPYSESTRKRAFCKDWMVVDTVIYEPVSLLFAQNSVISRKNSERT